MRVGIDARKIGDFGIGTYIRGLIAGLLELGVDVTAFVGPQTTVPDGVHRVDVDAPHYSVREVFAIGRAADQASIDVFHAPHYVVPRTKKPVVVTIHDLIHLHQPLGNPLARPYARTMLRRAARCAARVLTVSDTVGREIASELSCDASKIIVTPNGIDPDLTPADRR